MLTSNNVKITFNVCLITEYISYAWLSFRSWRHKVSRRCGLSPHRIRPQTVPWGRNLFGKLVGAQSTLYEHRTNTLRSSTVWGPRFVKCFSMHVSQSCTVAGDVAGKRGPTDLVWSNTTSLKLRASLFCSEQFKPFLIVLFWENKPQLTSQKKKIFSSQYSRSEFAIHTIKGICISKFYIIAFLKLVNQTMMVLKRLLLYSIVLQLHHLTYRERRMFLFQLT